MPERHELLNQFNANIRSILEIQPERLIREDLGAKYWFRNIQSQSMEILKLCRRVSTMDLSSVPEGPITVLVTYSGQILEHFNTILRFDPSDGRQLQRHQQLFDESQRLWLTAYSSFTPIILFNEYAGALDDSEKSLPELKRMRAEGQNLIDALKAEAEDAALAKEAKHFLVEAKSQATWSRIWFWITAGLSVALVAYAYHSLNAEIAALPVDAPVRRIVAVSLPRLVILAVSWFFVLLSARNYTACRHNHVVNRHRQNALAAFRTFAESPSDEQTKDAILIQATQCIFSPQSTGYLKGESEHQGMNQVIELIRSAPTKVALAPK